MTENYDFDDYLDYLAEPEYVGEDENDYDDDEDDEDEIDYNFTLPDVDRLNIHESIHKDIARKLEDAAQTYRQLMEDALDNIPPDYDIAINYKQIAQSIYNVLENPTDTIKNNEMEEDV